MSRSSSTRRTRALGPCVKGSLARQCAKLGELGSRAGLWVIGGLSGSDGCVGGGLGTPVGGGAPADKPGAAGAPTDKLEAVLRIFALPASAKSTRRSQSRRSKARTGGEPASLCS